VFVQLDTPDLDDQDERNAALTAAYRYW